MLDQLGNGQAVRREDRGSRIRRGDYSSAGALEKDGGVGACIAESLDGHRGAVDALPRRAERVVQHLKSTLRRRGVAPGRPAARKALAGHDRRRDGPALPAVLVGDPIHGLRVGVDVGRGNVHLRSDHSPDALGVRTGQSLQLRPGECLGVDRDPSLAATQRNVDHCGLDAHPGSERLDFVEVDVRVIADAALVRPAGRVVLHPVAGEDRLRAVVARDWDRHLVDAIRSFDSLQQRRVLDACDGGRGVHGPGEAIKGTAGAHAHPPCWSG